MASNSTRPWRWAQGIVVGLALAAPLAGMSGCGEKQQAPPPIVDEEEPVAAGGEALKSSLDRLAQAASTGAPEATLDAEALAESFAESTGNRQIQGQAPGIPLVESESSVIAVSPSEVLAIPASVRTEQPAELEPIEVQPSVTSEAASQPLVLTVPDAPKAIEVESFEIDTNEPVEDAAEDPSAESDLSAGVTLEGSDDDAAAAIDPVIPPKWDSPYAVLFITGQQHGYIEPCGCTGLENQKGGLMRRRALLEQIQATGWKVIPVDAGNQVRRTGRQPEAKLQTTADVLKLMDYKAVAVGPDDLKLSTNFLLAMTASDATIQSPFVCANVALFAPDTMTPWNIIEAGGHKIGLTSVLSDEYLKDVTNDEIVTQPAAEAAKAALDAMKAKGCEVCVLIAHASLEDSQELARQVPGYQVVVTAGGLGEPTYRPESIEGSDSKLIQVGVKGMFVGLLGLFADAKDPFKYQRVPLTDRYQDDPKVVELFRNYQKQLEDLGLPGLGLKPVPHTSGRTFVGTESCAECHKSAYDVWKDTPHALATDSIVHPPERSSIARHHDPECLSCHVTGWNAQSFFPYEGGYWSLSETPKLVGNGCENCHGPGSAHVAAEKGGDLAANADLLAKLRDEMKLPLANAQQKCLECHDIDNSPDFHEDGAFEEYWSQVEHHGKD